MTKAYFKSVLSRLEDCYWIVSREGFFFKMMKNIFKMMPDVSLKETFHI